METKNPVSCFILALRNYANFRGRMSRCDFWYFVLTNFLIGLLFSIVIYELYAYKYNFLATAVQILSNIYGLAMLIPNLSANARRLHDTNHSGWWMFLPIVNLVFWCMDSDPQTNRFGPNPKADKGSQWDDNFAQSNNSFSSDNLEKIEKLGQLRDQGILTEEEFQQKKKELL